MELSILTCSILTSPAYMEAGGGGMNKGSLWYEFCTVSKQAVTFRRVINPNRPGQLMEHLLAAKISMQWNTRTLQYP